MGFFFILVYPPPLRPHLELDSSTSIFLRDFSRGISCTATSPPTQRRFRFFFLGFFFCFVDLATCPCSRCGPPFCPSLPIDCSVCGVGFFFLLRGLGRVDFVRVQALTTTTTTTTTKIRERPISGNREHFCFATESWEL